jgi:RNA polymerase sigma-70 factor (ECF subfamily)
MTENALTSFGPRRISVEVSQPLMSSDSLPLLSRRSSAHNAEGVRASSEAVDPSQQDLEWMERLKHGDREALAALFQRHSRMVFGVSARILRNATEAQDLVQDVFLYLHEKRHAFDANRGTLASWLLRITYSRAFDRREYLNVRDVPEHAQMEDILERAQSETLLDGVTEAVLARQILERGLAQLTQREQATIQLFFFEGYTLREISTHLDETIVNTRHHYYRGLEKLRAAMEGTEKVSAAVSPRREARARREREAFGGAKAPAL